MNIFGDKYGMLALGLFCLNVTIADIILPVKDSDCLYMHLSILLLMIHTELPMKHLP